MSSKYPVNVFLEMLETRLETLPFRFTNTSQIITAKKGVVAINKMIPVALMKAPYLSASPPEPQCFSCVVFFLFLVDVVVFFLVDANDDDFCPPFLFVGGGDFRDDGLLLRLDERVARAEEPPAAITARFVVWWC